MLLVTVLAYWVYNALCRWKKGLVSENLKLNYAWESDGRDDVFKIFFLGNLGPPKWIKFPL